MALPAGELDLLRRDAENWLPDTCIVLRPTSNRDAEGGEVLTYASVGTTACRVASSGLTRTEQVVAAQLSAVNVQVVAVAHDADIRVTDRLQWADGKGATHLYEVSAAGDRSYQIVQRLLCTEVR